MSLPSQSKKGVEGGFLRNSHKHGLNRRRALPYVQPKREKTWQDIWDEAEAAHKRCSGMPPLVVAREMIAEANLPEDAIAELSAAVVKLNETGELEQMICSGKLGDALAELAAGATA